MAVREFKNPERTTIDVFLINGDRYLGRDIPLNPFGDDSKFVSFFADSPDTLMIIPIDRVKHIYIRASNAY